jgi:hypothetical protein
MPYAPSGSNRNRQIYGDCTIYGQYRLLPLDQWDRGFNPTRGINLFSFSQLFCVGKTTRWACLLSKESYEMPEKFVFSEISSQLEEACKAEEE